MSTANKKEARVTFQTTKGHRHQSSDSSISVISSSPSAQDYFDLELKYNQLLDDMSRLKSETKARYAALENNIEVLKIDKKAWEREKENLRTENQVLREDLRKAQRHSPSRESTKMSGALPSQPPSPREHKEREHREPREYKEPREHKEPKESKALRRSDSKHRARGESKVRKPTEDKELAKRCKEDKERLGRRFEHKDDKSTSSGSSRGSKQGSYIEPMGPSAPRPASIVEPTRPRTKRSESTSYAIRPTVLTTTTVTDSPYDQRTPGYPDHESSFYEGSAYGHGHSPYVEDGSYYAHPLPETTRGRSRR
ncbi:hypothetical protein CCUS01_16452 [Colletotrichum cuscutae]|uniref:Uncharacterized protein n=1 Tax=Colletotrichum cuscutae TaxID=1209917 RepID=A0AAI9V9J6_9PEZI|nr:hypothetical protein CCUS01_16452 [Colletotrichum cuscutae]